MVKSVCIDRLSAKTVSNVPASVRETGRGLSPAAPGSSAHQEGPRLPATQRKLMRAIHALGKPTILALTGGSALAIPWAAEHLPAILQVWYPGQAGGEALADVLFGDCNPSGKLPVTIYRSVEDLPAFDDYAMAGRTYRYFEGEPLYPFGHGLSYTTFRFDDLRIAPDTVPAGEPVTVSLKVTNTGGVAGDEVVQVYLHHKSATGQNPLAALKGFQRVCLEPGQSETVTFSLTGEQMARYDGSPDLAVCPGTIQVMCGNSSQNLPLTGSFEILD